MSGCQRLWVAAGIPVLRPAAPRSPQHSPQPSQIPTSVLFYLSSPPPPTCSSAAREPVCGRAKSRFLPPPRDGEALGCRDGLAGDAAPERAQGAAARLGLGIATLLVRVTPAVSSRACSPRSGAAAPSPRRVAGSGRWWDAASRALTDAALPGAVEGCCARPGAVEGCCARCLPFRAYQQQCSPPSTTQSAFPVSQMCASRKGAAERRFSVKVAVVRFWLVHRRHTPEPFGLLHLL